MHDDMLRIQQDSALRRDLRSGAVIDVDAESYKNYIKIKTARRQQQQRVQGMETRINNLESDIADIKSLLLRLLEK